MSQAPPKQASEIAGAVAAVPQGALHGMGRALLDTLSTQVALLDRACGRQGDMVAHLGGDECVLLAEGLHGQRLAIAVNVSARQFHDTGFCEQVLAAIARHGIGRRCLRPPARPARAALARLPASVLPLCRRSPFSGE